MPGTPQITPVAAHYGEHLADPAPFYATFSGRGGSSRVQFHARRPWPRCDGGWQTWERPP